MKVPQRGFTQSGSSFSSLKNKTIGKKKRFTAKYAVRLGMNPPKICILLIQGKIAKYDTWPDFKHKSIPQLESDENNPKG